MKLLLSIYCTISLLFFTNALKSMDCYDDFDIKQIIIEESYGGGKIYPLDFRKDTLFRLNPVKRTTDGFTHYQMQVLKDTILYQHELSIPFKGIVDIVDILVNDSDYIFLDLQHLWIFDRYSLNLKRMIELPNTMFRMDFSSDDETTVELSFCAFSSNNKNDTTQTYAYKYNLIDGSDLYIPVANPENIQFTYVKRQLESIKNDHFAISNPTDYNIKVYNIESNNSFTISTTKEGWNDSSNNDIEIDHTSPSLAFDELLGMYFRIFTIDFVQFVSDSMIFVFWSKPIDKDADSPKRERFYDVWEILDGKATLIEENIELSEKYCSNGTYYPLLIQFGFKRDYFYTTKPIPFLTNDIGESNDIDDLIDEYLIDDNPMHSSVYIYKVR
ncbi:MAG: hypothetical protein M9949_08435 [Candidatus Kapabacteria bacterium]|nr:hypothetical protein [Candidatus Kapabacteria bacterium]